jgi:mono/diheme cytochrome c family protein
MLGMMKPLQKISVGLFGLLVVGSMAGTATGGTHDVAQGRALYLQYCASCHGRNADGKGPVARALSTPPANLRLLWERYGNPLPEDQIARFIDGRADVKAHGPRDMPVWGEVWQNPKSPAGEHKVEERIAQLLAYLQSIQKNAQSALLRAVRKRI